MDDCIRRAGCYEKGHTHVADGKTACERPHDPHSRALCNCENTKKQALSEVSRQEDEWHRNAEQQQALEENKKRLQDEKVAQESEIKSQQEVRYKTQQDRIAKNQQQQTINTKQTSDAIDAVGNVLLDAMIAKQNAREEQRINEQNRRELERQRNEERQRLEFQRLEEMKVRNGFYSVYKNGRKLYSYVPLNSEEEDLSLAESGDVKAQLSVGKRNLFYKKISNDEETKNPRKAMFWLRKAALSVNAEAMFWLGDLYEDSSIRPSDRPLEEGVATMKEQILLWYKKSATLGNGDAQMRLGQIEEISLNYSEAYRLYSTSKPSGYMSDETNQFALGLMCEKGLGVKLDYAKALDWYKKPEFDRATCDYRIGHMYEHGLGVIKDQVIANEFYKKAFNRYVSLSEQNDGRATYALALMYRNGTGVEKDLDQSNILIKKVIDIDTEYAEEWSETFLVATRGNPIAQYVVGLIYRNGNLFVKSDINKSNEWLKKASEQGFTEATELLKGN
ncbi:tetratricopeptide repeat protein [Dyadobacter bucti]|uniref:tetratricopeptide repeat protein n=1 Tax=Dyadobacter bucti TaxID=2572203 RepID=UPI001108DF41|nr:tetratricopeptide repeat protein [Dyadobacter bucti]